MKRLIGIVVVGAVAGCATGQQDGPPAYLALGDSIAFGWDPRVDPKTAPMSGYPELVGDRQGALVINASCPGEATGGFISETGADNGCRENKAKYPMHVAFDGTQMSYAIHFLEQHPNTQLVTIDLGGNDLSIVKNGCKGDSACILAGVIPTLIAYTNNINFILSELRRHYDGPLVGLAIYNPFPADTTAQYAIDQINAALGKRVAAVGGQLADGNAAFRAAGNGKDPCAAQLLIGMPDGTCDIHPSPAGALVLANEIDAAVGRIP